MVVPTVSLGCPRIECCATIAGSVVERSHGASADSVDGDGRAVEAKVVADLAGEECVLAADKVVDVDREAVRILEEVISCRADIDAKCGGIKGWAVCGAAEAGILELVGDMEELLLHVHACKVGRRTERLKHSWQ